MTRKTDEKEYVKTYNEWEIYYSPIKKLYVADFEGGAYSFYAVS